MKRKMKKAAPFIAVLVMVMFFSDVSYASEIDVLREEVRKLKEDYESKIQGLQAQIDVLGERERTTIAKIEEKADNKLLDVEYVGRYEGPFKKGGLLIKNPSGFGNVSVGGYMDHEFEAFSEGKSTFDQHRYIINIGAELGERLRFFSEYEIEHGGPDASGGGEAKVEQAWVDYLISDWVNLRAGAILVPFGRYNIYHDSDLQDLTDRPLVVRDVIPTTWTESGAGIYGEFNPVIGDYEDLEMGYEVYAINGLDDGFTDTGLRGARGSIGTDNNSFKSVVGRAVVSPFLGHEIGLSGYWGQYNRSDDYITGAAIDWLSTWGPLELVGEWAYFSADDPDYMDVSDYFTGFYAQANYHFWPEFLDNTLLGRSFEDPTFTLVGRYGTIWIDDDFDVNTGTNEERRITLGLNYRPVESWVLKLEYQLNYLENERLERGDDHGFMASVAMGF